MSTQTTTRPLTRFWLALERLPGPAAVAAEWRRRIGADFERVVPLLVPDPEPAATFPRLDGRGEAYTVVAHGPDDFVGVGEEDERILLNRADLVVHRLAPAAFVRAVAGAFGIDPDGAPADGLAGTYHVGLYRPLAGFAFPVYLTLQLEPTEYRAVVEALLGRTAEPFLLLAPTNRHHRIATRLRLDAKRSVFLPLADAIRVDEAGRWGLTDVARGWLGDFNARVLPASGSQPTRAFFPTPAAARWSDVSVRFVDGDRVAIKVGAVTQTVTYAQMGMADGRNAKCTKQWELLRVFARNRGTLTWDSRDASRKHKKQCETLAGDLRAFFRIAGDPIELTDDRKGWRTVFAVEPD